MTELLGLFLRAWLIVTLVALNTRQIARGQYLRACITGFLLSWVWWTNAHSAAHDDTWVARLVYAAGGAVGTGTGMWIGRVRA